MKLPSVHFPGVRIAADETAIVVSAESAVRIASSAVLGGGISRARYFINYRVPKGYCSESPEQDILVVAEQHGIREPVVGMMTAAKLDGVRAMVDQEGDLGVLVIMTLGLTNLTAAGVSRPGLLEMGTINTLIVLTGNLTDGAMINALMTATEAKTLALIEVGARTREGGPATGTSTDSMAIACLGQGDGLRYAGTATEAGWLLGRAVRAVTRECVEAWTAPV